MGATVAYRPEFFSWYGFEKYAHQDMDVSPSNIGTLIDFPFDIYSADFYPNTDGLCFDINAMTTGTYIHFAVAATEYDWYAGEKRVFAVRNKEQTDWVYVKDRRKFDNEWYFLDSWDNYSYPFDVRNPTPNTTYTNYNKGELRLKRWN